MKRRILLLGVAVCVLASPEPALAQDGRDFGGDWHGDSSAGQDSQGGISDDGVFSEVRFSNTAGDTEPPGVAVPVGEWEPPACWFEARTASEAEDYVEAMLQNWQNIPEQDIAPSRDRLLNHFVNGQPYEDYNLAIEDEGAFWFGVTNPSQAGAPGAQACSDELPQWVANGETPDDQRAVTPETLAQAAYEWLPLPETEISLNPQAAGPQTVNLPTWIWQDTADIGEVSATASLDRLGIEATTTAVPSALSIDPGTQDAEVHPGSGECDITADGTIGQPYTAGRAEETPPCGVTYLRATHDGQPYELRATITWSVTWTGTGNPDPQPLPDTILETTHDITVEEIQTIVR